MEWHVAEDEPKLFREQRAPQLPEARCTMPKAEAASSRRRLLHKLENHESSASAERICSIKEDYESCMEDVLATGDLDLTGAW